MTDYDINKVSPRPWVVHRHPEYGFSETDGNKFTGVPILRAENRLEAEFLHAVHCVNIHDELVAALSKADLFTYDNDDTFRCISCGAEIEDGQQPGINCKNPDCIFVRAKGES